MDDLHVLTSECDGRSLVMLDEIGRGTSTREGAALGVALLEWLDAHGMSAMFSTHLHEMETILRSSPPLPTLHRRCLRVSTQSDGGVQMHYVLEEGVCTDSLALHAARVAGLPDALLSRMEELTEQAPPLAPPPLPPPPPPSAPPLPAAVNGGAPDGAGSPGDASTAAASMEETLDAAAELLLEVSGAESYLRVPCAHEPPPRLSGRSCVYVIQMRRQKRVGSRGAQAALGAPPLGMVASFYVGESDSISQRLRQHRARHRESQLECVLVEVESKSRALEMEALLIRRLKAMRLGRVTNIVHS